MLSESIPSEGGDIELAITTLQSFAIDPSISIAMQNVSVGLILASVSVQESSPTLLDLLDNVCNTLRSEINAERLSDVAQIAATRKAYRTLGKDPGRYRGAAEALVRRLVSGKPLYHINNVVDINNLVSLQFLHPVGSYDAEKIHGEIRFRLGLLSESYEGIGKHVINTESLPVLADMNGAFGSPTSDSERTKIVPETRLILTAIMSFLGPQRLEECVHSTSALLRRFADACVIQERIC